MVCQCLLSRVGVTDHSGGFMFKVRQELIVSWFLASYLNHYIKPVLLMVSQIHSGQTAISNKSTKETLK